MKMVKLAKIIKVMCSVNLASVNGALSRVRETTKEEDKDLPKGAFLKQIAHGIVTYCFRKDNAIVEVDGCKIYFMSPQKEKVCFVLHQDLNVEQLLS